MLNIIELFVSFATFKLIFLGLTFAFALKLIYQQIFGRSFGLLKNIPGPKPHIILGNIPLLTGGVWRTLPENFTERLVEISNGMNKVYTKNIYKFWLGPQPVVVLNTPEAVEILLSSNTEIDKSINYKYLHPWLGTGLLTSTGGKWRMRRKMLTSAFHFKILEDFIPIINEQSLVLIKKLEQMKGQIVDDIVPHITTCTLDIICETAMGVNINAQNNPESEYIKSLYTVGESFMYRNTSIFGFFDFIYYRTKHGKEYTKCLHHLHEFTRNVIKNRKRETIESSKTNTSSKETDPFIGQKKRLAFLDLLLENHLSEDSLLTEEDIREEVDTFMFEGHDTTSMAICWTLYLLGLNHECQQKVYDEIEEVFGDDNELVITGEKLKQLKYTEYCIKESLRIFPSVPVIARDLKNDLQIGQYTIPKGTAIFCLIISLHNDPENFPNPQAFIPERFLPENVSRRNPFSYVPFSAGPRNCIGQRFALMEEKIIIASIVKNFIINSLDERDKIRFGAELVTRPKCPLRMQFVKR